MSHDILRHNHIKKAPFGALVSCKAIALMAIKASVIIVFFILLVFFKCFFNELILV